MFDSVSKLMLATAFCSVVTCGGSDEEAVAEGGEVASEAGTYQGVFSFDPEPSITGDNTLHALLTVAGGEALEDATLVVEPWMPSMGHGSTTTPMTHDMGDGNYHIESIAFTMPGGWEVRIGVSSPHGDDRFVLTREVQ